MAYTFEHLKAIQRQQRESFPEALSLRTHRALSWLHRAEQEEEDDDAELEEMIAKKAFPALRTDLFEDDIGETAKENSTIADHKMEQSI